jgi:hypothetical protein
MYETWRFISFSACKGGASMRIRKPPQVGLPSGRLRTTPIVGGKGVAVAQANSSLAECGRQRRLLRQILTQSFNEEELKSLCFDMGIDYESLPGAGKAAKARELIGYFERRGSVNVADLVAEIVAQRPNASELNQIAMASFGRPISNSAAVKRVCYFNDAKFSEGAVVCSAGRLLECHAVSPTSVIWRYLKDC